MSENEQNDSYNDVFTLTAGVADPRPDSSAQFTPSIPLRAGSGHATG